MDDDRGATRVLKILLERRSYRVRVENNPRESFDAAGDFDPDVILLDVIMPEMDGVDVAKKLRREERTKGIPIVFISASARPIPGFPFLEKPVPFEDLIACVDAHVNREAN